MNVYDFDGTIYDGDSTLDFWIYCMLRHPSVVLFFPKQLFYFGLFKLKIISRSKFKEVFYSFLSLVPDKRQILNDFWDTHFNLIMPWYHQQKSNNDIIITASPEFLIKEICERLNIKNLIASKVDINTGKLNSENNRGEEKVKRLINEYPDIHIDNFYSDSLSDLPLALIASQAFLIKSRKPTKWVVK